ncbi:MAG: CAP domain-containing protein [Xanthomonadales bacterium]|nr:CAP domain-containing protein [Xanthomonadales bacterium]
MSAAASGFTCLVGACAGLVLASLPSTAAAQDFEHQVVERVNLERWQRGQLPPLKAQSALRTAAWNHSQAMGVRNFFAHCDLDTGSLPWDRMIAAGYHYHQAAENIAAGQASPAAVVASWLASPGHLANILSPNSREIGVGYYLDAADQPHVRVDSNGDCVADGGLVGPYRHYWTQKFGRRNDVFPVVIAREAWQVDECLIDIHLYGQGWAQHYRLSNDGQDWSAWQPFASDVLWPLAGNAGGTASVHAQIRNGAGQVRSAQDSVRLAIDCAAGLPDLIFANGFQQP